MIVRRRPLLRAAAVGGAGYLAGRGAGRRSAQQAQLQDEQDQRISDLERQQAVPPYPQPPGPYPQAPSPPVPSAGAAPAAPPLAGQLDQLAALHQQGVLTDGEFAAAKARLLGTEPPDPRSTPAREQS